MKVAINFILFQVGWFVTVIGVANRSEWIAVSSVFIILFVHLYMARDRVTEIFLMIAAGAMGFIADSILISTGLFSTLGEIGLQGTAPLWLVCLWMLFAITINYSLGWMKRRYVMAMVMGTIFAPLAYLAGSKFGVISFSADYSLYFILLIIGMVWAVVTPSLLLISCISDSSRLAISRYTR